MARDSELRRTLMIGLGLIDYIRDRWDELQEELVSRGEERTEDIRDFWDDIKENLALKTETGELNEEAMAENTGEDGQELGGLLSDVDVEGIIGDFIDDLGLATSDDLSELNDRLDRLARAIENL